MDNNPLVSVIVPCYNHERFVEQCIRSIKAQTYQEIQLIIIDDGSTDGSAAVIKGLQSEFNFIFESKKNEGLTRTLNYAIGKYASGKYISILASDDYWFPEKIKLQVKFMEANSNYGMVCGQAKVVDLFNNVKGTIGANIKPRDLELENLLLENKIPALTALYRRDIFHEVGGYDETLYFEDWDLWLRIAEKSKIGLLNVPLGYYRMHAENMSAKSIIMSENQLKLLDKWRHNPSYKRALKLQQLIWLRINILAAENKPLRFKIWKKHLKSHIFSYRYYIILLKLLR
ncbi:MAG: glycosyltransferase [Bacteroidota bacterium]